MRTVFEGSRSERGYLAAWRKIRRLGPPLLRRLQDASRDEARLDARDPSTGIRTSHGVGRRVNPKFAVLDAEGSPRAPEDSELRAMSMAFLLGVCIEELQELGFTENQIRECVDMSFARRAELQGERQ